MPERRRLPVLQSLPPPSPAAQGGDPGSTEPDADADAIESRPPWQWVGFGTVAIFAAWLPLAYAAQAAIERVVASRFGRETTREEIAAQIAAMASGDRARLMAILALPNILALGLAAFGGGYVVGRFGAGAGVREAATAGAMTALVAVILSLGGGTAASSLASGGVTAAVAVGFAAWGGRIGRRGRARRDARDGEAGAPSR